MLTIYPSNRLEDLATLLLAVIGHIQKQADRQSILKPQQVIVENRGIRHWLNMEIARRQGIAMNLHFQMPGAFIWSICRRVLGEQIPEESLFSEDVLRWRIDSLLADETFQRHSASQQVNEYWQKGWQKGSPNGWQEGMGDELKRFQLASKLSSVFQQYMTFRPDWLSCWDKGESVTGLAGNSQQVQQWQAHLWRLLTCPSSEPMQGNPVNKDRFGSVAMHPVHIQNLTLSSLKAHQDKLPKHILVFGVNQMPVASLRFLQTLAEQTDTVVHLFHLNPCVDYWGDLRSDKQRARENRTLGWSNWLSGDQVANPLIANLGQQGKEFCEALQNMPDSFEISAFDEATPNDQERQTESLLSHIQKDILTLRDARTSPACKSDDSIYITSAHSPLREIQALHDYLLHQVNDPEQSSTQPSAAGGYAEQAGRITPADVLVMCPNIEDYAPYIDAVFRRPWQAQEEDDSPRWPCSIADRNALDEEPLVSAFMDLLNLPDSRFEMSSILDYLRLPALQNKFGFTRSELDTIEWWLQEAAVHWGIDAEDKKIKAGLSQASETSTWLWGLERLLLGFAFGDTEHISDERLLLPHVEGQQAVLLGRLIHVVEQLKYHARELLTARTGDQWQSYLQEMKDSLFAPDEEDSEAGLVIDQVVSRLFESVGLAGYSEVIDYRVIRSCLNNALSHPDASNHFMVGQVTFCSMIPMRSVPYKIIAVLGLNDSDFPRQDRRVSFDLMNNDFRPGDRSRRNDDRYLFLETIISARDKLYLSYQGKSVKDNQPRQPSLVLKELMNYLEIGYGWQLTREQAADLHQQPLHPFSPACFLPVTEAKVQAENTDSQQVDQVADATADHMHILPSFNKRWCRLVNTRDTRKNYELVLGPVETTHEVIDVETLVRFFEDPLKTIAQQRLGLTLENDQDIIDDTEPFTVDYLTQYQIRSDLCETRLDNGDAGHTQSRYVLSGKLPESPLAAKTTQKLDAEALSVYHQIQQLRPGAEQQTVEVTLGEIRLGANLTLLKEGKSLFSYRPAICKPKDKMRLWLTHLIGSASFGHGIVSTGVYLNDKKTGAETITLQPLPRDWCALDLLQALVVEWQHGLSQPSILHASLGCRLDELNEVNWVVKVADQLGDNPYFQWFYGQPSEQELSGEPVISHLERIRALYGPMNQVWQGPD